MRNKSNILLTGGLLLLCLVFLVVILNESNHKKAVKAINAHEYDDAVRYSRRLLSFYKDAAQLKDYAEAGDLLAQGGYTEAKSLFFELDDYRDAKSFLPECDYRRAAQLLADGDTYGAGEIFLALGGYRDSAEMVHECDYVMASKLLRQGVSPRALDAFLPLARIGYKDSAELVKQAAISCAKVQYAEKQYGEALTLLRGVGDYGDAPETLGMIEEGIYQSAVALYEEWGATEEYLEGGFEQMCIWFAMLDTYKDARQYTRLLEIAEHDWQTPYPPDAATYMKHEESLYKLRKALFEEGFQPAASYLINYHAGFFLEGRWKGDGKSMRVTVDRKKGGSLYVHDLPGSKRTAIKIQNSIWYFGNYESDTWTEMYHMSIQDMDTVTFLVYSNDKTYTLRRQ